MPCIGEVQIATLDRPSEHGAHMLEYGERLLLGAALQNWVKHAVDVAPMDV